MNVLFRRALLALAFLGMALYCAVNLRISTDITNFLPDGGRAQLAALSRKLAASELTRTMAFTIAAGADIDRALRAARDLAASLSEHPEVAWVRTEMPAEALEEAIDLYLPRRFYFVSADPEDEIPRITNDESLRNKAEKLLSDIRHPTSTFLTPLATADPLGILRRFLERARMSQPEMPTRQGQLISRDQDFALLMLGTVHSHFESDVQTLFLYDLDREIALLKEKWGSDLEVEKSGANRVAVRAEQSIKRDIYWISICTFFGVAVLFLLFFRTLYAFVLASLPAVFGVMTATVAGTVVLGGLDGLTLAFGAALTGVAIDYAIHVVNHHALSDSEVSVDHTVKQLTPSLLLGAVTTIASFAGLMLTTSPAFRELGFFSITGIAAALGATVYFLPAVIQTKRHIPNLSRSVAAHLGKIVAWLRDRSQPMRWLVLLSSIAALWLVPSLRWVDDLSRIGNVDRGLIEEEIRVRSRFPTFETGRFVIAMGPDAESALRKNDIVYARLQPLVDNNTLGALRSLHTMLWSRDLQERNLAALRNQPDLEQRIGAAFHDIGFRRDAFETAFETLHNPPPPLTLGDLQQSSFAPILDTMVVSLGDQIALITHLREVKAPHAIQQALEGIDGVVFFDQRSFVNQVYTEFRSTTLRQVLLGTLLVAAVLLLRYRAWKPALAAILPSLLVVIHLLATFSVFAVETNLLHVISLMMVMGMGVDYGVFLVDAAGAPEVFDSTMLSLFLSCLTTILVFGTLAISEHPALRAIGVTTGAGILLAFVLAPLSLIVVDPAG